MWEWTALLQRKAVHLVPRRQRRREGERGEEGKEKKVEGGRRKRRGGGKGGGGRKGDHSCLDYHLLSIAYQIHDALIPSSDLLASICPGNSWQLCTLWGLHCYHTIL